jgi:hypothetical protein
MTPNQATIVAALLSAVISALVAIFTSRYVIKHGANYQKQIEDLRSSLDSIAQTQEGLRIQHEKAADEQKLRHELAERRKEAARWRPEVTICSVVQGNQQANTLNLKSAQSFLLRGVSLLTSNGVTVFEYPMNKQPVSSTGFSVPVTHESLVQIANSSSTYGISGTFEGKFHYKAERENGDGSACEDDLPFRAEMAIVANTVYFRLVG